MMKVATHPACFDQFRFGIPNQPQPYRPQVIVRPRTPMPFVVWGRAYTGEDILLPALRHHLRIRCELEAFHEGAVFAEPPLNWTTEVRDAHRFEYIDHLLNESTWSQHSLDFDIGMKVRRDQTTPPLASGFKATLPQMTRSEFAGLTASPTIKKIVLRRRNFIDMFMDEAKRKLNMDPSSTAPITLDTRWMLQYLNSVSSDTQCLEFARRYAAERGFPDAWVIIPYETLVRPETATETVKKAMRLIIPESEIEGWTLTPLPSESRDRITRLPKNETIANYEEVREAINADRRYLWMLMA